MNEKDPVSGDSGIELDAHDTSERKAKTNILSKLRKQVTSDKGWKGYAPIVFAAVFIGVGLYTLLSGFAATPPVTKTWSTAADWNTGTLASTAVSGNAVILSPQSSSGSGGGGGGSGGGGGKSFVGCTDTVSSNYTKYSNFNIQTNEWDSGQAFTICNSNNGPNFQVETSKISQSGGPPGAYPSVYVGDHWGTATADDPFPVAVSALETNGTSTGKVTTSYNTTTIGSGAWDDAYDIWYNPTANTANTGSGGLEMMVWLNHMGGVSPAGSQVANNVSIGGLTYNIWWNGSGTASYVLSSPQDTVTNLNLGALAANAVSRGYMKTSWYLNDVEAGFEVWNGGVGLTANNMSVTVNGTTVGMSPAVNTARVTTASATSCSFPIVYNNGGTITDGSNQWNIKAGIAYVNGGKAGFSENVTELAEVNGVIWQENSSNLWWSWNGTGWSGGNGSTTSPITGSGGGGGGGTTTYPSSGTITLTFNASKAVTWDSVSDKVTTPTDTTVALEERTSTNDNTWSAWTTDVSKSTASQYIQIQAKLTTMKSTVTPTLTSLSLVYTSPTGTGGGGGTGGGTPPPTTGTNATVNFSQQASGTQPLNTYSIGDTLSTYGGNTYNVSNQQWRNELAALGPLAWRVPERMVNGVATGAGTGGGGTGYVQYIKDMGGVPVVIAAGQNSDDSFNNGDIQSLANYYNANGGENGGPVTAWIVGNEPEGDGGWGTYRGNVDGVINAIKAGSTNVKGLTISAGTVWDQGDITSDLPGLLNIADAGDITYLSWHAYQGADNNGSNSGVYAGPLYEGEEKQAVSIAKGKQTAIEEFNWNSGCNNNQYYQFDTWQDEDFIASVIGNVLAGGGSHAYMYADSNGCGTLSAGTGNGGNNEPAYTQLPAYWALGMWTGMSKEFDRFGSTLVDTKVDDAGSSTGWVDVTNPNGKEAAGLAHEVDLFATNNGKILAINKNVNTSETLNIGLGGLSAGTHAYQVWETPGSGGSLYTSAAGSAGAPKEIVSKGSVTTTSSGGTLTISLPPGSIASIDVSL